MATAELRELSGCCWRCETAKETEAKQMGARLSAGGAGMMKARLGASWPGWVEQRRRAAVSPPRGGHGLTAVGH